MNNRHVVAHKQRLDDLFALVKGLDPDSDYIRPLARHLCVLASGFLGRSVEIPLTDWAQRQASPRVARFVASRLAQVNNVKYGKLRALLEEFDADLAESFHDSLRDEERAAIDSVVSVRHQIAHGQDTGLSFATISQYYGHLLNAIGALELVLDA